MIVKRYFPEQGAAWVVAITDPAAENTILISELTLAERAAIAALAQQCLDAQGQGPQVQEWEAEIDERVVWLYGLSAADLKAIKGE
ncbi:MAG TPA: hypothetical protein PKA05_21310 [Roseiflexaceae bacterium]|nr:hypothetical protein [Roseiflexaceae bacterium]HMP42927.1 hypothetical protein [Roseiflexaceae bacterium]